MLVKGVFDAGRQRAWNAAVAVRADILMGGRCWKIFQRCSLELRSLSKCTQTFTHIQLKCVILLITEK